MVFSETIFDDFIILRTFFEFSESISSDKLFFEIKKFGITLENEIFLHKKIKKLQIKGLVESSKTNSQPPVILYKIANKGIKLIEDIIEKLK